MTPALQHKVDFAIKLLRSIPQDGEIEVSFSGGKDSEVILELAKMAKIPYRAIYKNTTCDPPGTIAHCKSKGVEVLAPTINFFDLVKHAGMPTRFRRICCFYLKEYKVLDRAVQGIISNDTMINTIAKGIVECGEELSVNSIVASVAQCAVAYADALIAELDKNKDGNE